MKITLNQLGDTMVEVLIAMGIISLILASGYSLAQHNLTDERRAQERGEGLQLVQGQLEILKSSIQSTPTISLPPAGTQFCLVPNSSPPPPYKVQIVNMSGDCVFHADGTLNPSSSIPAYLVVITQDQASPNTFQVQGDWAQAGGGTESVSLIYREYP